jgi:hypothetical protein
MKSLRFIVGAFAIGLFIVLALSVVLRRYFQAAELAKDIQSPSVEEDRKAHEDRLKNDSMYQIGATEGDLPNE